MAPFVEALGHEFPPRDRSIPYRVIRPLAALMEDGAKLIRPFVKATSPLTRSSIDVLCHDISIETDKAERLFGYRPRYSTEEAFERTVAWFRANAV
jgi:nucleoside-diphosphate-sugar epimerase